MKKAVAAGIILLSLGAVVCGISFVLMGFKFSGFVTEEYEKRETVCSTEFSRIDVQANVEDVTIIRAEDAKCRVICSESDWLKHTVSVEGDTLTVRTEDSRKWYEHIGVVSGKPEITLYIPAKAYDLKVETDTGDVEIRGRSSYGGIDVRTDTGDVRCEAAANGSVSVQTSTGDILWEDPEDHRPLPIAGNLALSVSTGHIRVTNLNCSGNASVHVSTGKTVLESFTCASLESTGSTGRIALKNVVAENSISIRRSTGDVELEDCDAADLHIKTDTGDVTGTLRTEKIFFTETSTGKVQVPRSTSGGECEITTDTGDIRIEIKG